LERRLSAEGNLEKYTSVLMDFVKNYAVRLPLPNPTDGHFVPHFPVYKVTSATTPIRPVFNGSASPRSVSDVMAKASFQLHKWTTTPQVAVELGLPVKNGQTSCL